ncbi:hypothetical protein QUF64_11250 [Anaerolineales bacterium HSG6]|nr:hypothetical protein [Anaerolineales bacterium HSG6]MDM8530627.1 hypothetical protein [Anaerolineales bacterium HSG25]
MKLNHRTQAVILKAIDGAIVGVIGGIIIGAAGGVFLLTIIVLALEAETSAIPRTLIDYVFYGAVLGIPVGGGLGIVGGMIVGLLWPQKQTD